MYIKRPLPQGVKAPPLLGAFSIPAETHVAVYPLRHLTSFEIQSPPKCPKILVKHFTSFCRQNTSSPDLVEGSNSSMTHEICYTGFLILMKMSSWTFMEKFSAIGQLLLPGRHCYRKSQDCCFALSLIWCLTQTCVRRKTISDWW